MDFHKDIVYWKQYKNHWHAQIQRGDWGSAPPWDLSEVWSCVDVLMGMRGGPKVGFISLLSFFCVALLASTCIIDKVNVAKILIINTFLVVTHSYVSQATHAFIGMLPLCFNLYVNDFIIMETIFSVISIYYECFVLLYRKEVFSDEISPSEAEVTDFRSVTMKDFNKPEFVHKRPAPTRVSLLTYI